MNVVITGSSGFIGSNIHHELNSRQHKVTLLNREIKDDEDDFQIKMDLYNIDESLSLSGNDTLIHCAALVPSISNKYDDEFFDSVNFSATMSLAKLAIRDGVSRFVFISSVKVNGESSLIGKPFTNIDSKNPQDDYGKSKSKAEDALLKIAKDTDMDVVIIRPTLVYGSGVKGNFLSLMNLVSKGLPLPFGCINDNKRSLISVTNLVDLIITCIDHPKAANQVFLVSDDDDLSTSKMVKLMASSLGKGTFQLPVPKWCYKLVGAVTNKRDVVSRLLGSLQVDMSHTKEMLDWVPPQTIENAFQETADAWIKAKESK